uniref:F-box domain-containing protein n=1 Tax=Onchocerca volvulus TaxID=6282 RepID=A0A8R1TX37_ONCVO
MAADVCAEQLPSTSYATTVAISSSSTTPVMQTSQALVKVATSTTLHLGSCYMSQSASSAPVNYHQDDEKAGAAFAISSLPPEILLHILKHLPRCDIDNCRFVCKRWKEMIDRNIHSLRKHLVQMLELREYKSRFILTLNCSNLLKSWTFCEHITSRPSFGLGKRRCTRISTTFGNNKRQQQEQHDENEQQQLQQSTAKLPLLIYMGQNSPSNSYLPLLVPNVPNDSNWHTEDHDERKRREHTPSQLLCERMAKYFHEADIHFLRLTDMRFTDRFVDRLLEAFETCKIRCKKVEISMCKLNYVSPKKFHQLLQLIECQNLSLIWLRGNHGHVNSSREFLSEFLGLSFLSIFAVTPPTTIGDDEFLADFLEGKVTKCLEETVLRIDNSSITTNGICRAIDKWKQTSTRCILNLCVGSEHIDIDELLRHLSLNQSKPRQGAFRIAHPQLPDEALLLWDDKDGIHIASNGKPIS